eukprot:10905518-Ditylum_brightwellii.AAC.1
MYTQQTPKELTSGKLEAPPHLVMKGKLEALLLLNLFQFVLSPGTIRWKRDALDRKIVLVVLSFDKEEN